MVKDEFGNKLEGFYLVGFFEKNERWKFHLDNQKPFVTDENGESRGKCYGGYPHNCFPREWMFLRTQVKLKDVHKDEELKKDIDDILEDWCKKHKRKFQSVWESSQSNEKENKK